MPWGLGGRVRARAGPDLKPPPQRCKSLDGAPGSWVTLALHPETEPTDVFPVCSPPSSLPGLGRSQRGAPGSHSDPQQLAPFPVCSMDRLRSSEGVCVDGAEEAKKQNRQ